MNRYACPRCGGGLYPDEDGVPTCLACARSWQRDELRRREPGRRLPPDMSPGQTEYRPGA